jgi:hypothetical protein
MTTTLIILLAVTVVVNLLIARHRGRRRARRIYQHALERALADGVLTDAESAELAQLRADKDLTSREVRMAALALYRNALHAAAADERLTPEEDRHLERLQQQLGLSSGDLGSDFLRVSRLRMLAAITEGRLPEVACPIDLVTEERCHWVVHATLARRLDVTARAGRITGIHYQVLAAEPFHAHGERDALEPSEVVLPIDLGVLVVTSRRTVLQGAKRTVSIPHARLQAVVLFSDGVGLEEHNGNLALLLVDDAELTAAVILHAARQRRAEIRPTSAGRSA